MPGPGGEGSPAGGEFFRLRESEDILRNDPPLFEPVENGVPPLKGAAGVPIGAVHGRPPEHSHQEGRLGEGELPGALREVHPGCGLHPPDIPSEGGPVQIEFKDPVLREDPFRPKGLGEFIQFRPEGPGPGVREADELARDGGGTRYDPSRPEVSEEGPEKGTGVHPRMLTEPAVLHLKGDQGNPFPHGREGDGERPLRVLREKDGEDLPRPVGKAGGGLPFFKLLR
ncbi:hypothetical protein MASR2M79_09620 [Aminivibrio sp.]